MRIAKFCVYAQSFTKEELDKLRPPPPKGWKTSRIDKVEKNISTKN